MNVGILSYSSVCQRKFLPALLLNDRVREITIASSRHLDLNEISKKINCVSYENFFQKDYDWVYISSIPSKNFEFSKKSKILFLSVLQFIQTFASTSSGQRGSSKRSKLGFLKKYASLTAPPLSVIKYLQFFNKPKKLYARTCSSTKIFNSNSKNSTIFQRNIFKFKKNMIYNTNILQKLLRGRK